VIQPPTARRLLTALSLILSLLASQFVAAVFTNPLRWPISILAIVSVIGWIVIVLWTDQAAHSITRPHDPPGADGQRITRTDSMRSSRTRWSARSHMSAAIRQVMLMSLLFAGLASVGLLGLAIAPVVQVSQPPNSTTSAATADTPRETFGVSPESERHQLIVAVEIILLISVLGAAVVSLWIEWLLRRRRLRPARTLDPD
jgi:hypothetical protein